MKTKLIFAAVFAFCIFNFSFPAFGQGALTPPGAPAPTMKTLAQIDAKLDSRTPISSVPFTITNSGSYYLTTNLTATVSNAIVITASGVTLDLGGFTIASTVANAADGGTAILLVGSSLAGLSDITIVNGHIRGGVTNNGSGVFSGSGFINGIYPPGNNPVNARVIGVSVSGCQGSGIYLGNGDSTVVEGCTVRTVGGYGIYASTVKGCVVADCGSYAIYGDQVSDCRGIALGSGTGISATTVQNCYGKSTGNGTGINASTLQNCYGQSNTGTGLSAFIANSCHGATTSGIALSATHNVNSF